LQAIISNPDVFTEEVVRDLLNGEDSFYVFGYIKYYDKYTIFGPSEIGYCFSYVPPRLRYDQSFDTCAHPKYTYNR
jgi:hypothetical protein